MTSSNTETEYSDPTLATQDIFELQENLIAGFNTTISDSWVSATPEAYLAELDSGIKIIKDQILAIGDVSFAKLKVEENLNSDFSKIGPHYFIAHQWMDHAKSFIILWRDTFFEGRKALLLHLENKVQTGELENLRMQSYQTIQSAATELKNLLNETLQPSSAKFQDKTITKQIEQWKLEDNPYPVYRDQLEQLVKQIEQLNADQPALKRIVNEMLEIKSEIKKVINTCIDEISNVQSHAQDSIEFIENHDGKITRITTYLEDVENKLSDPVKFSVFSKKIDKLIENFSSKDRLAVGVEHGMIQYKEINFKKNIRQWLDAELLPILFETWEIKERNLNDLKMSFLNIRNRSILLSNEQVEGEELKWDPKEMSQPLHTFLKKTDTFTAEFDEKKQTISNRLNDTLGLFTAYNKTADFLYVPLPNTIRQINWNQNEWIQSFQRQIKLRSRQVQNWILSVQQEEALSVSEKIVRIIQTRTIDPSIQNYSNIFLTKGYIGASFCVGRQKEFQHIQSLIQQWKSGFRGAVILSGQRFSGKTLFGNLVAKRFFPKNNIRIAPNEVIKLNGRQHTCTYDLGDVLEFIRKNTLTEKVMLWIDDIELWSDEKNSLSQNVRELCTYLDNYSKQNFMVVSVSNWLQEHLNVVHNINKKFQAEINLDYMSREDIIKAITIRHGATHQQLVNNEGEEVSMAFFRKSVRTIHKRVEGNIGEALRHWSIAIHKLENEKVIFRPKTLYPLPDFLDADAAILLAVLMNEKQTNEYQLNRSFGKPFGDKYRSILKRMQSVGVVTRTPQGQLEVNEKIANDVGKLLAKKQILKYYHE